MQFAYLLTPLFAIERAAGRLRAALADPARGERNLLLVLALYVVLWAIYGTVTKSGQGLNPDMTELVAWSRDLDFGYSKHPPLAAWLVRAWFTLLPVADWSYYLLAMLMPAITLWIVWRLSADYLTSDRRVAGLALLMLIPFFHFHALKFNVNTVLMPLWAAATLFFLRSYVTRLPIYAALAGVAAAACMLGKYWSIFLLAGLAVAALVDQRRSRYFRSTAPYVTILFGAACIAPHIAWLFENDFVTFSYAAAAHVDRPFTATLVAALGYFAGSAGYVALPVLIMLIAARPSQALLRDMAWPIDDDRRLAAAAFWAPLLLPAVAAVISGSEITSLWSMSAWALLPVLLLSPPKLIWRAADTSRVVALAAALTVILLLASPFIAMSNTPEGLPPPAAQGRLLAREVERLWREAVPQPLRYIGGEGDIVLPVATYADDRPRILIPGLVVPADEADVRRAGMVLLCFAGDDACLRAATARIGGAPHRTIQTAITQNSWGKVMPSRSYTVIVVPPRL